MIGAKIRPHAEVRPILRDPASDIFDCAADGVATVERALRAAQHFDSFDIVDVEHCSLRTIEIDVVEVKPELVVEIAFNEIQVSSRYESGLALRFARVKSYRPEKSVLESDTFQTVQALAGIAQ